MKIWYLMGKLMLDIRSNHPKRITKLYFIILSSNKIKHKSYLDSIAINVSYHLHRQTYQILENFSDKVAMYILTNCHFSFIFEYDAADNNEITLILLSSYIQNCASIYLFY